MKHYNLSDMIETVMGDYACEKCGFWYSYHDPVTMRCPYKFKDGYNTFDSWLLEQALEGTQLRTPNNPLRAITNPKGLLGR